jgi:hypothetical protein
MNQVDSIARDGAIPVDQRTQEDSIRLRQRTQDIMDLSLSNGIITEYTSFLAEGRAEYEAWSDLLTVGSGQVAWDSLAFEVGALKLEERAQNTRTGAGAANQVMNKQSSKLTGAKANITNGYVNADMEYVSVQTVQQTSDLAFFQRGDRWIDSRLIDTTEVPKADRTLAFGTDEFDVYVRQLTSRHHNDIFAVAGNLVFRDNDQVVLLNVHGE